MEPGESKNIRNQTLIHFDPAIWGLQGCSWPEMAFLAVKGAKNGTF